MQRNKVPKPFCGDCDHYHNPDEKHNTCEVCFNNKKVTVKCKCKISEHDDRVCTEHGVYGFIGNPTDECGFCRPPQESKNHLSSDCQPGKTEDWKEEFNHGKWISLSPHDWNDDNIKGYKAAVGDVRPFIENLLSREREKAVAEHDAKWHKLDNMKILGHKESICQEERERIINEIEKMV